jgi:alkylation response protein AidB-like acyl-CoA dehydrogenase
MEQLAEELLERVAALRPAMAERVVDQDREGRYPFETMALLADLGLAGLSIPTELGGMGLGVEAQLRITEEIARADGSAALAYSMHRTAGDILAVLPPFPGRQRILDEVCKEGAMLCSVASIPTGDVDSRRSGLLAKDDGDHWLVSGRSGFATNSEGSRYIGLFCGLEDVPGVLVAWAPMDAPGFTNLGNWAAMGMRSSSSHDVLLDNVRIPKDETWFVEPDEAIMIRDDNPDRLGQFGILGVWLGLAQAAYDFTLSYTADRFGLMAGAAFSGLGLDKQRNEESWAQIAIGRMDHAMWVGRETLYAFARKVDSGTHPFTDVDAIRRERVRLTYQVRLTAEQVALDALKVCGAHAYVQSRPLERIFRDALAGIVMKEKNDQLVQLLGQITVGQHAASTGGPLA